MEWGTFLCTGGDRTVLFVIQGFYWVEERGAASGVIAEKYSDTDCERKRDDNPCRLDCRHEVSRGTDKFGRAQSEKHSDQSSDPAHDQGFKQKLPHDVSFLGADRFTYPDFTRALRHIDQHYIHDPDAADQQRYARDSA